MSKYKRSGRPQSSRSKRTTRPRLEVLESRLVLSRPPPTVLPTVPEPRSVRRRRERHRRGPVSQHPRACRRLGRAGPMDRAAQGGRAGRSGRRSVLPVTKYTTDVVESYDKTYLGRDGDPAGVASWVAKLQAGAVSEEEVAAAFLSSPEYIAKNVTDAAFVQSLYENILGRAGDPAGINNWTQLLGAGTSRGAVAASFIGSP